MFERLPKIGIVTRRTLSADGPGFLRLDRRRCVLVHSAHSSEQAEVEFTYDTVLRRSHDAATVVAYCVKGEEPHVYMRSCVRPPLSFREESDESFSTSDGPSLWELPAGIIDEEGPLLEAARVCAARELLEEAGFDVDPERFRLLGHPVYPLPAMIAERQVFFEVEVEPAARRAPVEDGSPLEREGQVICISLTDALAAVAKGALPDSKTELGLRRFQESWQSRK